MDMMKVLILRCFRILNFSYDPRSETQVVSCLSDNPLFLLKLIRDFLGDD